MRSSEEIQEAIKELRKKKKRAEEKSYWEFSIGYKQQQLNKINSKIKTLKWVLNKVKNL